MLFVAGSVTWTRLQEKRKARRAVPSRGESASSAVPVASTDAAGRDFAKLGCACGSRGGEPTFTAVRFGEGEVLRAKATCACGETRRRYYVVA